MAEGADTTEQEHLTVEVDDVSTVNDSVYGDELSNYSTSLTSSVLNFRKENGRTYHGYRDGSYLMPNDEDEADRLDILHEMFLTMTDRKLFLAPIGDSPQHVIDLGTGTGIWALDFGDQYPSAEVIGVDLSPIQPTMVSPNVKFLVDDIEQEWLYNKPFDFIHGRFLTLSIKDYKKLIKQAYDNTVPGGWVEFQDWDEKIYSQDGSTKNTSIEQYFNVTVDEFERAGIVTRTGRHLEGWFRETGFEDIHVKKFLIPMGTWPKDERLKKIGMWNLLQGETGFEAGAMAVLTRYAGWTKDEVTVLVAKTRNDARNPAIHGLFDFYIVYGRKPLKPQ
ncbi:hypothetical protein VTN77DRAFT_8348 [Rasamsonia byssochlamydoides]|uniref:uncharacterized protein n=1 Tax=Rasamsonia byssochlamydoides TaxID=89139 RepID=UPI0037427F25